MLPSPEGRLARLAELPTRAPKRTLGILILLTIAIGSGVVKLRFDPSSERVFPEGHWAVDTFEKFRTAFGGDEAIFLAVEAKTGEDVFSPQTLTQLRELTKKGAAIDGIAESFALTDMPVLRLNALLQPTLVPGLPEDLTSASPKALDQWKREILATPFVDLHCVSKDRKATLVFLVLERLANDVEGAERNLQIVNAVSALVESTRAEGWTIGMAGTPLIKARIMSAVEGDLYTFAAPLILISLIASAFVLRSVRGTALVMAVLIVSLDLTLGTMGHLGIAIDPINTMVPVLILVIGVADTLHLLVEQRTQAAQLGPEADGATTIAAAARHVCTPCLLTSLTTAIGFGSLVTSDIPPVADFGVAAALSSLVTFGVSMLLVPAAASLMAAPNPRANRALRTEALGNALVRWPRASLALGLGLSVVVALGSAQLYSDTNFLEFFDSDSQLVKDARVIEDRFAGVAPAELLIEGPPGISKRPDVLEAIYAFERDLEKLEIVDAALSASDVLRAAVGVLDGTPRIPKTEEELFQIASLLKQIAGDRLPAEQLISPAGGVHPDVEWLRVSIRARAVGSSRFAVFVAEVERLEKTHLESLGLSATPTGTAVVFSQTADRIMAGQIESFVVAFVIITIVMIFALRSLKLGLLSIIPNLMPIAAMLGTMGYLGIPLNSFNSMIASIAIGIAVDDTIHIMTGFKRFSSTLPLKDAVRETVAHEGAAILATSAVLFAGFCVLLFASFHPTANFGFLTAVAIAFALIGDLLLVPGLLLLAWPETGN
jgi:uncharacterized protein